MELIKKLETKAEGWLKGVPHLPAGGQKWLADNVWWIVLIGAIASAISFLVALFALFGAISLLGVAHSYYGYYAAQNFSGWWIVSSVVSLLFAIATTGLMAAAIKPLQSKQKKGWTLLFTLLVLDAVVVVINAILSLSVIGFIFGIIFGAIGVAIGAYLLFEIRGYFGGSAKAVKTAKK